MLVGDLSCSKKQHEHATIAKGHRYCYYVLHPLSVASICTVSESVVNVFVAFICPRAALYTVKPPNVDSK